MSHFTYHSEQVHSAFVNGKGGTRRNIVKIRNGKGEKAVELYSAKGKLQSRKTKGLTADEIACIKRNEFIPGLFRDCGLGSRRNKRNNHTKKRRVQRR